MGEVLRFPCADNPMSLSHGNGIMFKTEKSVLYGVLEVNTNSEPQLISVTVIDASFFLYLQINLPATFGGVARTLLSKVMGCKGDVIHCHRQVDQSIN